MRETIIIQGLDDEAPEEAREQINNKIHGVLREDFDMCPDVVYWEKPKPEPDP